MTHLSKLEITSMQIKRIEKEIRDTPYHKGTEHHIGRLRGRLAKLLDDLEGSSSKSGGGGGVGYSVKKQGDATIILIGPPSAGKSTLLNALTNAKSKVAPYSFTTVSVIPGMMYWNDAKIQILDVPGLIEGAEEGKGRGREVLSVTRGADLILIMTDVKRISALERIEKTLVKNGLRLNQSPPNILINKKLNGGLTIHSNLKQELSNETIKEVATEMGIKNADITLKEKLSIDRLIDSFSRNRVYVPAIKVINKIDTQNKTYNENNVLPISVEAGIGIEELKREIWNKLNFLKVYLIRGDDDPTYDNPLIVKKGASLLDIRNLIGGEFMEGKIRAKIWGSGSKFPGQEVSLTTIAQEGMQIKFV